MILVCAFLLTHAEFLVISGLCIIGSSDTPICAHSDVLLIGQAEKYNFLDTIVQIQIINDVFCKRSEKQLPLAFLNKSSPNP